MAFPALLRRHLGAWHGRRQQGIQSATETADVPGWLVTTALVLAEAAIVYLVAGALIPAYHPPYAPPPAWGVALLLLACTAFARLVELRHLPRTSEEPVLWIGLGFAFTLSAKLLGLSQVAWIAPWPRELAHALIFRPSTAERPVWGIVALVAYAWWRGRTREPPDTESTYEQFRLGVGGIVLGLILALLLLPPGAALHHQLPLVVLWYMVASLAAIGLARLRIEALRASAPLPYRSWIALTALALAAVLVVAVGLALLLTHQTLIVVWAIMLPILWLIALLVQAVILLLAAITFVILFPVLWLLQHQHWHLSGGGRLSSVLDALGQAERFARVQLSLTDPARYLLAAAVLAVLGTWLVRRVFRRQWRWRRTYLLDREPLAREQAPLVAIGHHLARLLRRPRPDPLDTLRRDPRWRYTVAIRLCWRRLLRVGQRLGLPQKPGQTPSEYAAHFAEHFPEAAPALQRLTQAYLVARYRPEPADAVLAATAEQAWEALRQALSNRL